MATASFYLTVAATLLAAGSFAAHVAHLTLLAGGRRLATALVPAPRPASAGVVGGSFAAELEGASAAAGQASPRTIVGPFAIGLLWAALACLVAALVARGIVVGRGPWGNFYECSVAFAAGVLGGYALLERRLPVRALGLVPTGIALCLLLYAWTLPREIEPLVPALQNPPLLTVHVGLAMISYGIFAMSFAAGIGHLVQARRLADGSIVERFAWLPSRDVLDQLAYRSVIVGFPIFAAMIVLGSWWASIAWSRWWGWDPKETAALVTWLVYAVYLHLRNQRGWNGRPAALVLVVGFVMVLVTYSGNLWFPGLHAYSGLG